MSILVITTGGTIGALPVPDPSKCPVVPPMPTDGTDLVLDALKSDLSYLSARRLSLEAKDSKFIDDVYRDNLIKSIDAAPETSILVTHGTDALLKTADYMFAKRGHALKGKTVLLTGAMVPLANGHISDGYQNLKFALEQLQSGTLSEGIYIVLSDYVNPNPNRKEGWAPCLYVYQPGVYEKEFNRDDSRYSRLRRLD